MPGEVTFYANNAEKAANEFCDYDVVEISDAGICRALYSAKSNNNAIVVTSQCNSNCIMCPSAEGVRMNSNIMPIGFLCELVEYIPSDAPHITVTGGEPTLLKNNFFKLMSCLNEHLPQTNLLYLTNARAFSNKGYSNQFNEHATSNVRIAVPVHASYADLHDKITCAEGSFEQTIAALHNIAPSVAEIELRVVVTKLNIDDLNCLADLLINKIPRITCVNYIALEMSGNAAINRDNVWIDYEVAFNKIKECIPMLIKKGIDVNLYNFPLCSINRGYWGIARQSISDYKVRYVDECDDCTVKEICGGQFASTLNGDYYRVKPIRS
jgi:His-Xaa-Ser system radical SAM maturase HxsC